MSKRFFQGLLLIAGSALAQTKVACIGASICAGVATTTPYSALLEKLLGPSYKVYNEGVSGACMLKKADSPYWNTGKLDEIANLKPSIITIDLGGNDAKPQNWAHKADFGPDLIAMVTQLEKISPKPTVYVCLTIPAFQRNGAWSYGIDGTVIHNEQVPLMKHVIDSMGYRFVDLHNPLLTLDSHFGDGVHPDVVVHDTIAHLLYRAMMTPTALTLAPEHGAVRMRAGPNPFLSAGEALPEPMCDLLGRAPGRSAGRRAAFADGYTHAAGIYFLPADR